MYTAKSMLGLIEQFKLLHMLHLLKLSVLLSKSGPEFRLSTVLLKVTLLRTLLPPLLLLECGLLLLVCAADR